MKSRTRPKLLDLCCGAGGMSMGFHKAGFEVVGVDIEPQPDYPFEFRRANACATSLQGFDAYSAGPPCQLWSVTAKAWNGSRKHPDLIGALRHRLLATGRPYVIENVRAAPLFNTTMLCGSMFDRPIERHRYFEANFHIAQPACDHIRQWLLWPHGFAQRTNRAEQRPARVVSVFGRGGGWDNDIETWQWAMGIDWVNDKQSLAQCVPPIYAQYIGEQMMAKLKREACKRSGTPTLQPCHAS